ncbi:hypothetical protein QB607_003179 [Clostridium botulinum]|nr:hypothetical protein [Clostridium botulinum]EKS4395852.1 hypothetical protein [Clostridium botulinum]
MKYKGINTSNYNDMLNLYRDIKEQYKNESVIIDFIGKSADGQMNIMWQKEIVNKDAKIKEYAERVTNIEVKDIAQIIIDNFKMLRDKKELAIKEISVNSKLVDAQLHNMEEYKKRELNGEYISPELKIAIFDTIAEQRLERRKGQKDKQKIDILENYLSSYKSNFNTLSLENIIGLLGKNIENIESIDNKKYDVLTEKKAEELKIIKKVSYKNFKDRINKMKQLQKEYDKVYYDNSKMEIICYNKAKVC